MLEVRRHRKVCREASVTARSSAFDASSCNRELRISTHRCCRAELEVFADARSVVGDAESMAVACRSRITVAIMTSKEQILCTYCPRPMIARWSQSRWKSNKRSALLRLELKLFASSVLPRPIHLWVA